MTHNQLKDRSVPENPDPTRDDLPEKPNVHTPLQVEKLEGRQESGRDEQDEAEEDEPEAS